MIIGLEKAKWAETAPILALATADAIDFTIISRGYTYIPVQANCQTKIIL